MKNGPALLVWAFCKLVSLLLCNRLVLWFGGGVPMKQYKLIVQDGIPIEHYVGRTLDGAPPARLPGVEPRRCPAPLAGCSVWSRGMSAAPAVLLLHQQPARHAPCSQAWPRPHHAAASATASASAAGVGEHSHLRKSNYFYYNCLTGKFLRDNCPAYLRQEHYAALRGGLLERLTISTRFFLDELRARKYTRVGGWVGGWSRLCARGFGGWAGLGWAGLGLPVAGWSLLEGGLGECRGPGPRVRCFCSRDEFGPQPTTTTRPHATTRPHTPTHHHQPPPPRQVILMDHVDWLDAAHAKEVAATLGEQVLPGGIVIWRSASARPPYADTIARAGFEVTRLQVRRGPPACLLAGLPCTAPAGPSRHLAWRARGERELGADAPSPTPHPSNLPPTPPPPPPGRWPARGTWTGSTCTPPSTRRCARAARSSCELRPAAPARGQQLCAAASSGLWPAAAWEGAWAGSGWQMAGWLG